MSEELWNRHLQYEIIKQLEALVATLADVNASVAALKTKVEAYVAAHQGGATAADLDTVKASVDAITAEVPGA